MPVVLRALQAPLDKTLPRTQRHIFLNACVAAHEQGHPLPSILVDAMTTILLKEVATAPALFSTSLTGNTLDEQLGPFLGGFAPAHSASCPQRHLRVRVPDHEDIVRLQGMVNQGHLVSGITGGAAASLHHELAKETPFQGHVEPHGDIDVSVAVPSHVSDREVGNVICACVNLGSRRIADIFGVKVCDIIHLDDAFRRTADYNAYDHRINGSSTMHIVTLTYKIRHRLTGGRKIYITVPLPPLQIIVYRQNLVSGVFDPLHPQKKYDLAHCEFRQYTYI